MNKYLVAIFTTCLMLVDTMPGRAAFPLKVEAGQISVSVPSNNLIERTTERLFSRVTSESNIKAQNKNGMAIASFVCGIVGLTLPFPLGILATIFGAIALSKNKTHRGLAIAGLVLGIVETVYVV